MDTPTTILSAEHKNILKVIDAVLAECELTQNTSATDKTFFDNAIEFIRHYADRFHHAKEEDILFAELEKKGTMPPGPVQQMLREHDMGRDYVSGMREGITAGDSEKLIQNAQAYCQLLKQHIYKEDNILYPMADRILDDDDNAAMLKAFSKVENEKFSPGEISRYIQFAEDAANRKG